MTNKEVKKFASWLGRRSYQARIKNLGIERIREIARENGKKGGRPPKKAGT
jgi:galactokinase/mevalonate kinase-like predicted kinase